MKVGAIVPAAGAGRRMKADRPKQFLVLDGVPILVSTLRKLDAATDIDDIVVAAPRETLDEVRELISGSAFEKPVTVIGGGERRQDSVEMALRQLDFETEIVVVHDGVRPFVTLDEISRVISEARNCGAAIVAIPITDTVKEVQQNLVKSTLRREHLVLAQTPQAFRADLLRKAFDAARKDGYYATDEASLVERIGLDVSVIRGSETNIKITRPTDLSLARFLLEEEREPVE